MKILIIQDFLRSGGTERQSVLLANAFAAAGHEATLLTFRPGGTLDPTVSGDVHRHALQPVDFHLDWFAPGLRQYARRAQAQVVLCMGRMANCHALRLKREPRLPARVVMSMRTGKSLPKYFRRGLASADHVVANSREAADTLANDHAVPRDRISVIYNSLVFPPAATLARNEALRQKLGAQPTTAVLVCVAMFRPEKNQRELIEIVDGLTAGSDWQLWLAGDGPERAACERLARQKRTGSRIKFPGYHADPSPLYRAADFAVHASWSEALSNFLIEAQAHGLPAVAYRAQGIEECFLPGRTGWAISREDRAAFRAALTRIMAAPPGPRAALAAAAQSYARATFDPARQVSAHLELFARLL